MRITGSDLDQLRKQRAKLNLPKSRVWPTWCLIFIPGTLTNPLNASGWTWFKRKKWTDAWHDKTAGALFEGGYRRGKWDPKAPKRITYTLHVRKKYDTLVNARACLKPIEDALVKCGVIHTDAPDKGHIFDVKDQVLNRSWRGVEIKVECL